ATRQGAVVAFGDAAKLGYPASVGGAPVALVSADPSVYHYTVHYTDAQYALLVRTAAHFHLAVDDVPSAGVAALAMILKSAPHPATKPAGKIDNRGPHTISVTYDAATNATTLLPVEQYLATTGDNTLYVGGLLMEYFALVQGLG
ncbi:MAG TPA: hypothetical protein VN636_17350, partial [Acidimicrobiia bacterium]|nr:hypothetical protein [Acidimicrobiia bacterium]